MIKRSQVIYLKEGRKKEKVVSLVYTHEKLERNIHLVELVAKTSPF